MKWKIKEPGSNILYRDAIEADKGCFAACCQKHFTLYRESETNLSDFVADVIVSSLDDEDFGGKKAINLIAAAPDLLEACKKAKVQLEKLNHKPKTFTDVVINALNQAIAKAKGGE